MTAGADKSKRWASSLQGRDGRMMRRKRTPADTTDSCLGFGARQSKFAVLCVEEYKRGFSFFAFLILMVAMLMMGNFYQRVLDDLLVHHSCSWEVFVVVFLGDGGYLGSAVGNTLQYYM